MKDEVVVVAGADGFIGGALVAKLRQTHKNVRAVDIKPYDEWYQIFDDVAAIFGNAPGHADFDDLCVR